MSVDIFSIQPTNQPTKKKVIHLETTNGFSHNWEIDETVKMDKPEWETSKILSKILNRRELDKVAPETVKKVEKFFEERFDEYLTTQALYETLQRTHCKYIGAFLNALSHTCNIANVEVSNVIFVVVRFVGQILYWAIEQTRKFESISVIFEICFFFRKQIMRIR